jgi:hypothetical protein
MEFSYEAGEFFIDERLFHGQVILSDHKLFLKKEGRELIDTFIPLEKIISIKKSSKGLVFLVRRSQAMQYQAIVSADRKNLNELLKDIIRRRGLKKKFLKQEWVEEI